MKMKLQLSLLLLLPVSSGCLHFSELQLRSNDPRALAADTVAVETAVGSFLGASKFTPIRDRRFEMDKQARPNFVDEWQRSEYRGFWNGGESIFVEMYLERDFIFIKITGDPARRTVVDGIAAMLQKQIHDKFPDFKVQVRSYSYFPFWAP